MENFEFLSDVDEKIIGNYEIEIDRKFQNENDAKNVIFSKLEDEGYTFNNKDNISIKCNVLEQIGDKYKIKVILSENNVTKIPVKVDKEKVFNGSFILEEGMDEEAQKRKAFELMTDAGIEIDGLDYEIQYQEKNVNNQTVIDFFIFKNNGINDLINAGIEYRKVSEKEILPFYKIDEEIYNGVIETKVLEDTKSDEEKFEKVLDFMRNDGFSIDDTSNLSIRISDIKDSYTMFSAYRTNYIEATNDGLLDADEFHVVEIVGTGTVLKNDSIETAIQRNNGIDIRDSSEYFIIYDDEDTRNIQQNYSLFKYKINKRTIDIQSDLLENSYEANFLSDEQKKYYKQQEELNLQILKTREEIEEMNNEVYALTESIREKEEIFTKRLEEGSLTTDEEYANIYDDYYSKNRDEFINLVMLERIVKDKDKTLKKLLIQKRKLDKDLEKAEELRITVKEYLDIVNVIEDKTLFKQILATEGLEDIVDKMQEDRTRKDKKILRKKKKEIIKEIATVQKENNMSVLDAIENIYGINTAFDNSLDNVNILYNTDETVNSLEDSRKYEFSENDLDQINLNTADLPEKVVNPGVSEDYIPLDAPADMVDVYNSFNSITLYEDQQNGNIFVNEGVIKRFMLDKSEETIEIDNEILYRIDFKDAEFIINNADNNYAPYSCSIVEINDLDNNLEASESQDYSEDDIINFGDSTEIDNNENIKSDDYSSKGDFPNSSEDFSDGSNQDNLETITIYIDQTTGECYAKKYVFVRFNALLSLDDEVLIDNITCFKLNNDDLEFIKNNANNEYSPYKVNYKDIYIKKSEEESNTEEDSNTEEEVLIFYRDLNDNNQIYINEDTLSIFGLKPNDDGCIIDDNTCYKISNDAATLMSNMASNSSNPKYIIKYKDIRLKKKVRPHVETILDKLTDDLDIGAKDYKRFTASNIKVSKEFVMELKSGNYLYNIVHIVPSIAKATFKFLRKLCAKLFLSKRGRRVMKELERRLDEELNEEELEVLFDEYKGSQLKTDMNNQINGMILKRLKKYGLEKVENLNESIKNDYSNLFTLLGNIKSIEKAKDNNKDINEVNNLEAERRKMIDQAAEHVKNILICRKDANNLLSGGVHGLEEDFKAVATKLSYVGMRFSKDNKFDNELQHELSEYGTGITEALENGDNEALVDNFMGLESCYFDNTEINKSLFGKRSVGSKYYSPLAEQFDYRDDPFIRDVFTTVALTSSAVSAVNSYRVHQIEANELLMRQQKEAEKVNETYDYVNNAANDLVGKSEAFKEGMKASAHKDVLSSANTIERSSLDMNNWTFNDSYHQADALGHSFYNEFHQNVTNSLNDITSRYGNGSISQMEALQNISDVADSAQKSLINVVSECNNILKSYAETHPKFDLSGISESMDYIVSHPEAIGNMNQAMVETVNIGNALQGLDLKHIEALSSLPSDMLSTIVCAASASSLALNVSKTLNNKYYKKNNYGDEVVKMMEDYLNSFDDYDIEEEINKVK